MTRFEQYQTQLAHAGRMMEALRMKGPVLSDRTLVKHDAETGIALYDKEGINFAVMDYEWVQDSLMVPAKTATVFPYHADKSEARAKAEEHYEQRVAAIRDLL